jgi:hypothetical protein
MNPDDEIKEEIVEDIKLEPQSTRITGGKRKSKRRGNASLTAWVAFVKKVQKEENLSYRDAMMRAKVRKDKGEKWMKGGEPIDIEQEDLIMEDDMSMEDDMKGGRRRRRTNKRRASKKRRHTRRHSRSHRGGRRRHGGSNLLSGGSNLLKRN